MNRPGRRPTFVTTSHTAVAVVAAAGLLVACAAQQPLVGTPVPATAPTRIPPTRIGPTKVCTYPGEFRSADPTEHGLVFLRRSPVAVVFEWLPGTDQRPCDAVVSRSGARVAHELAAAVDAAPVYPPGSSACPGADLTAVHLFLLFAGSGAEEATVDLSGCEGIGAPGRSDRQMTQRMADDLRAVAPRPWKRRLRVA